ncbi:hypothetical protein [Propionivibrio sp.]|uniref:hypothetical protein n=1 Tax=Propionivibrio sp. TaxID=2212460 RepID=UPI003BF3B020
MSANPAMIYNFGRERAARMRRPADLKPRISLEDAQRRIAKCCEWLSANGIGVQGFVFSTLSNPVIFVSAQREVWGLFSGRVHSKGHYLEGALKYEAWQGFDEFNHVEIRWEEVSACA